jgi:hypothetical protein
LFSFSLFFDLAVFIPPAHIAAFAEDQGHSSGDAAFSVALFGLGSMLGTPSPSHHFLRRQLPPNFFLAAFTA